MDTALGGHVAAENPTGDPMNTWKTLDRPQRSQRLKTNQMPSRIPVHLRDTIDGILHLEMNLSKFAKLVKKENCSLKV